MTTQMLLSIPTGSKSRESLANDIWQACDILRRDNNCGGIVVSCDTPWQPNLAPLGWPGGALAP